LLEISITLVIVGMMVGFGSQVMKASVSDCPAQTTAQIAAIKDSLQAYVRSKGIYPRPAGRGRGETNPQFGRSVATNTDTYITRLNSGGYVLFGALPFQTLGLPSSFASDCWGNKFTYIVTENLTIDAATYGTSAGNIVVKTGTLATPSTIISNAAYAVISHGPNGTTVGGVRRNFDSAVAATQGWCTVGTGIDTENCDVGNNVIFMAAYNAGAGAGANYFDDLVGTTAKPGTVATGSGGVTGTATPYKAYCWGNNTYRQLGNGTTTSSYLPTLVTNLPNSMTKIAKIGFYWLGTCAIAEDFKPYCWGLEDLSGQGSWTGRLAGQGTTNGATGSYNAARAVVNIPSGFAFKDISGDLSHVCALTDGGDLYCWGGDNTVLGSSITNDTALASGAVWADAFPAGVPIQAFSVARYVTVAVGTDGNAYSTDLVEPARPAATTTYSDVMVSYWYGERCLLRSDGRILCYTNSQGNACLLGRNASYPMTTAVANTPTSVTMPGGVTFTALAKYNSQYTGFLFCAIGNNGRVYCWGAAGSVGDNTSTQRCVPTGVTMPIGVTSFSKVAVGDGTACAISDTNRVYCWGFGSSYEAGTSDASSPLRPTIVDTSGLPAGYTIRDVAVGMGTSCALVEVP